MSLDYKALYDKAIARGDKGSSNFYAKKIGVAMPFQQYHDKVNPTPTNNNAIVNSVTGNTPTKKTDTTTLKTTTPPTTTPTNSIRDYAGSKGYTVGWDSTSKKAYITNPNTGKTIDFNANEGEKYGIGDVVNNQHQVTNSKLLDSFLSGKPEDEFKNGLSEEAKLLYEIFGKEEAKRDKEYNSLLEDYRKLTNIEPPSTLTYNEALQQATDKLNPLYENGQTELMDALDKNAVNRGFFGQLPTEAIKSYKANELNNQRSSDISDLASSIQNRSQDYATQQQQLASQQASQQLTNALAILGQRTNMDQSRRGTNMDLYNMTKEGKQAIADNKLAEQESQWKKNLEMAKITGILNTENGPVRTLDFIKTTGQLFGNVDGVDTLEQRKFDAQDKQMAEKISQTWTSIANSKRNTDIASQRLGLDRAIFNQKTEEGQREFELKMFDKAVTEVLDEYGEQLSGNTVNKSDFYDEFGQNILWEAYANALASSPQFNKKEYYGLIYQRLEDMSIYMDVDARTKASNDTGIYGNN